MKTSTQTPTPNTENTQNRQTENLVKISTKTNVRGVIRYIVELFNVKNHDSVTISGLNQAISNVVLVAEVVKTQILGLHQVNTIDCIIMNSNDQSDDTQRRTPKLEIVLCKNEPQVKTSGYQKPYSESEIKTILCIIYL
jgi:DNA-binding protein